MARRGLGPPITFRLPGDLHDAASSRAAIHKQTVDDYLRTRIIDALQRQQTRVKPRKARPSTVDPQWKTAQKAKTP